MIIAMAYTGLTLIAGLLLIAGPVAHAVRKARWENRRDAR